MKLLYLLRHAKSDWGHPELADLERPLNSIGLRAAPYIGETMYKNRIRPEGIFSSIAKRAKQTAILVKETAGIEAQVKYDDRIYEASPLQLLKVVAEVSDSLDSILVVGHNPGLEGLIKMLTGEAQNMPTAALAAISLNINTWQDIAASKGHLEAFVRPKESQMGQMQAA